MIAQGFESHLPMEKLAVRGYAEVLRHYREIMAHPRGAARAHCSRSGRPSSSASMPPTSTSDLERKLKEAGIPAIHYVSPSIWAWRGWRIAEIARSVTTCW